MEVLQDSPHPSLPVSQILCASILTNRASLMRFCSHNNEISRFARSSSALSRMRALMLLAARLRVQAVANWARETTCSIAERTCLVQAFGRGILSGLWPGTVFSRMFHRELLENTIT